MKSRVYLVGAGPGDPGLLTCRAVELLAKADAIVYDALVGAEIRAYFSPKAELIYVGKRSGMHSFAQSEINALLIETVRRVGGTIVRLKGGDPFVFGRGGEEVDALRGAGIAYEVVSGVTAGISAPAYAGIPVTHRGLSRSVTLFTATTQEGGLPPIDWEAVVRLGGTSVFYMSMNAVPEICRQLIGAGYPADGAGAIISEGTLHRQRVLRAKVGEFTDSFVDYKSYAPGLFMIGEVVPLADSWAWLDEARPLRGKRVVVTRALAQSSALADELKRMGAEVSLLPTIEIVERTDKRILLEAIGGLARYEWLALTSTNAVDILMRTLWAEGLDARALAGVKLGVVGPATAERLRSYGLKADFCPEEYSALGFAKEFVGRGYAQGGGRLLLPCSAEASTDIAELLGAEGMEVDQIAIYDNRAIEYSVEELSGLLVAGVWVTFCSSSSVHHFVALTQRYGLRDLLSGLRFAVIGKVTESALRGYGLVAEVMPSEATIGALALALSEA